MVLHKHGERLYSGLKEVVTNHLESKVRLTARMPFSSRSPTQEVLGNIVIFSFTCVDRNLAFWNLLELRKDYKFCEKTACFESDRNIKIGICYPGSQIHILPGSVVDPEWFFFESGSGSDFSQSFGSDPGSDSGSGSWMKTYTHTHKSPHTYTHIHTHTHKHTQTQTHIHKHTHIHTTVYM